MGKFMIIYDEQQQEYHFPCLKHPERQEKKYQNGTLEERKNMDKQHRDVLKYYFISYGILFLIGVLMMINGFKLLSHNSSIFYFLVIVFSAIGIELSHYKMMHTGIYYKERYRWVMKMLCFLILISIFTILI